MSFTNQPEKPFMTVVHGRTNVLAAFTTLDEAQADAASYWVAGNNVIPSTPVEVHGYNEVWGEWKKLFTIAPGSTTLPWAVAAAPVVPVQTREEAVAQARTQALAPVLELHRPITDPDGSSYCAHSPSIAWPCPTAIACGIESA